MKKCTVAIVASVDEELAWLKDRLTLDTCHPLGRTVIYQGVAYGLVIFLGIGGVGSVSMATAVTALICSVSVDYVLLIGSGGGFAESGIRPLDVAIATQEIAAQLGVESPRSSVPPLPLAFVDNKISLNSPLAAKAASVVAQDKELGKAFLGPFLTVSTVTASAVTATAYYNQYRGIIENMEGFGAAYPCNLYGIPLLELRVSSNYVGDRNKRHWHLKEAAHKAQRAALLLLKQEVFH